MDRSCGNCGEPVMGDGYGELIHIIEVDDKDVPGSYFCFPGKKGSTQTAI